MAEELIIFAIALAIGLIAVVAGAIFGGADGFSAVLDIVLEVLGAIL